jgi:hypothetical protein
LTVNARSGELLSISKLSRASTGTRLILNRELEVVLASAQQLDPSFDLKGCTWDDLLYQIEAAIGSDDQKSKNSRLRRTGRNASADVQMLNSLLSIIPDEKGLSLLRGGLSIVFQVSLV